MSRPSFRARFLRPVPLAGAIVAIVAVLVLVRVLQHRRTDTTSVPVEAVGRRSISQTVEATGTVQPVEVTEIRSKASGQILKMPVQIGSVVKTGDMLAQIDPLTVRNQFDEAQASLDAARAQVAVTKAQKDRADQLFSQSVMTVDQHESAVLAYANAQSQLVNARSTLSNAKQALDDASVRAPYDGTIIEQDVTKGQVIASAIQSASGGTLLLKMADLNQVQMEALVGETDVGNVRPGMPASVTVDAFASRTFRGVVLKIEPQAVVQQSVTMFPVLIAIANENGLLLPGMNGEVTISIAQANDVVAVPLDAVRTMRELPAVSAALGLDADSLRAQVQRQIAERRAARGGPGADSAAGPGRGRWAGAAGADSAQGRGRRAGAGGFGQRGGYGQAAGGRAAWMARNGSGGSGGRQGAGGTGAGATGAAGATGGGRSGQAQIVFVQTARGLEPRVVRLGISDFDYAQVLSGVKEGEQVALLSVAEIQAKRQQDQARMQQRLGTGMPGAPGAGGGRGGARGGP